MAQQVQGTLVQTIDTSQFTPPSTDTSGATYLEPFDTILLGDSDGYNAGTTQFGTVEVLREITAHLLDQKVVNEQLQT